MASQYSHYVAIDFGTAGSSVAFSTEKSEKIYVLSDWSKKNRRTGVSVKVPTIVLLDPDQNLEAVGEDALYIYQTKNVKQKKKLSEYYLFDRFKMILYSETPKEDMKRSFNVKAENGRELPVVTVIAKLLEFFKCEFIQQYSEFARKGKLRPITRIMWILTVPAIWSLAAKQIMKDAAKKAGLIPDSNTAGGQLTDSFTFALEPEAAAIFCQKQIAVIERAHNIKNGSCHYLIADCGGGTVDIAAHKLTHHEDGNIKIEELVHVHGGALGGFAVNDKFEEMFLKICKFSRDDKMELKKAHPCEWTKLMGQFEHSKIDDDQSERTIDIPKKIKQFIEQRSKKLEDLVEAYKNHDIEYRDDDDDFILPYSTLHTFLSFIIAGICEKIKETINDILGQKIEKIILVGGFANCSLLQETVKQNFPFLTVIISNEPWLSVVKGAVIFGKDKDIIYSRVMPYTIGVEVTDYFDKAIHDEQHKVVTDEVEYCTKAFYPFVKANQRVQAGNIVTYEFRPVSDSQSFCTIIFYATKKEDVKYTDENGCFVLGNCKIDLPKEQSGGDREISVTMDFTVTDGIKALACSAKTKEELALSFDFTEANATVYLSTNDIH